MEDTICLLSKNVTLLTGGIESLNWQVSVVTDPSTPMVLLERVILVGTKKKQLIF